jgi:hypothetical protein
MNKLKVLVLTALAAATVGTGALAAAPSASALPARTIDCNDVSFKADFYHLMSNAAAAVGDHVWATYYAGLSTAYSNIFVQYC